ncbi:hypothetical protein [Ideonella sp.]|uniref:hypothetical protein n=1 Tax=Ideonella sp. TaxID=1929293 RepID=UPI0035B0E9B8
MNARHPHPGATAPVTVTVEPAFTQSLQVATAVNPGAGLASVRNGSGDAEFFSIGSDAAVHHYHPDPNAVGGHATTPVGLCADTIAVTLDAAGAIVVFAASATTLTMVTEQPGLPQRWGTPVQLAVPLPPQARSIAALHAACDGSTHHLALLVEAESGSTEATYHLVLASIEAGQPPMFVETGLVLGHLNGSWMGNRPSTMRFVCDDGDLVAVTPSGHGTRLPTHTALPSLGLASAVDGHGSARLFAVLADGNAYQWRDDPGASGWGPLTQAQAFTQIDAEPDAHGAIHLLCLGAGRLWHLAPDPRCATRYGEPLPVVVPAVLSALTATSNDDGDVEVFAGNAGTLHYLAWDGRGHWDRLPVETRHGDRVDEHSAYGCEVQLRDVCGAPLALQRVTITATGAARITVNGATYRIDAHRAAQVCTNGSGRLHIQQPARALAAPTLRLSVPGLMPVGETIAISPDMVVQARLAALSGDTLYAATTPTGTPVLPDACRTPEQAAAIASAISRLMGLAEPGAPRGAAGGTRLRRARPGVRMVGQAEGPHLRRLAPLRATHWRFGVVGGAAQFHTLSADEAQAHLASLRATSRRAGGFIDHVDGVGDLNAGAAHGLLDITDTVITTIGGVVHAAVRFVLDGVNYLLDTAVTTVDQLFDLAEAVFAQVQVHFQTLHAWLGTVFDWPAIVRTAQAMSHTVQQYLGFFQGAVGGMQAFFDQGMGPLQATIGGLFDQAIQRVGGASVGAYADGHEPDDPLVQGALSNNPIFHALLDHGGGMRPPAALLQALAAARAPAGDDPYAAIGQALQASTRHAIGHARFAPMQDYFTSMGSAPGKVFSALLQDMLAVVRDLIQAVLAGLQAVVDQLLPLLQTMMGAFTAALNASWSAPVLSPLFRHATGGLPMSMVNLVSLMLAIPATALCQAGGGGAPFASPAELAAFEDAWDANTLLRASGLRGESAQGTQRALMRAAQRGDTRWTGLLPPAAAPVVATLGAVAAYYTAGLGAVPATTAADSGQVEPLSICGFVTGVLGQAASCPWFYAAGTIGCGGDSASHLNWTYANLGIALDLLYLVAGESIPGDVQSVTKHLYGNVHLALSALASAGPSAVDIAPALLAAIPETGQVLRLSGISAATEGHSLAVLAVLNAICMPPASTLATGHAMAAHAGPDTAALCTPLAAAAFAEASPQRGPSACPSAQPA